MPAPRLPTRRFIRELAAALILILLAASCVSPKHTDSPSSESILQATVAALQTQLAQQQASSPTAVPTQQSAPAATAVPTQQQPTPTATTVPTPPEVAPSPTPSPMPAMKARVLGIEIHHCPETDPQLASFAAEKGWGTEQVNVEPLTETYLKQQNVSILAIQNDTLAFTEEELREIRTFVEDGGGLLLQADQQRSRRGEMTFYAKDIARMFGVSIGDEPIPWVEVPVQSDHALMRDVNVFSISSNNDEREPVFLAASAPAYAILNAGATEPYRPALAAAEVGSGRVVIYPTMYNYVTNIRPYEAWSLGDDLYFLRNALYWLQQEELP